MKYFASIILSLVLFTACKKSNDKPNTTMTVHAEGDTTWTCNDVAAYSTSANTISISATNPVTHAQIKLGLYGYREGNKTYTIDYQTAAGTLNSATYSANSFVAVATTGTITLSNFTTKTLQGTFSFTGPGGSVYGTFIAPKPN